MPAPKSGPSASSAELVARTTFGGEPLFRYRLKNGLDIFLLEDRSAPVVAYHTWYRVGSRHEKPGKTGLAHFFEHLMFNETSNLKAGEFDRKLETAGAETNAATWVDWTYYHEAVPKDALGLVVKLEADRMANLVLREPQVTSEREVVANERRYRVDDDVEGAASELLYRQAFEKHTYGHPTIGWMEDIAAYTPEDCEKFYRTYYAPNNACVVVVGDVKKERALRLLEAAYGSIPASTIPEEDVTPEPVRTTEKRLRIHKPTSAEKLLYAYPGVSLGDPDHAALTVLSEVLFGGRGSRLVFELVIELEKASEVRGWASTFRYPGLFEITVSARPNIAVESLEPTIERALDRVKQDLVTDAELERAKARLELGTIQGLETANGKAEQIGFYETVLGDPSGIFRRLDELRRVRASDVRYVARKFLERERRVTLTVLKTEQPTEAAAE